MVCLCICVRARVCVEYMLLIIMLVMIDTLDAMSQRSGGRYQNNIKSWEKEDALV